MTKKCTICNKPAVYRIKDTPDFYCNDCAEENFGDVNMLVKVEEEAQKLKEYLETKVSSDLDDDEDIETEESAPVEEKSKLKKKKVPRRKDDQELGQDDVQEY